MARKLPDAHPDTKHRVLTCTCPETPSSSYTMAPIRILHAQERPGASVSFDLPSQKARARNECSLHSIYLRQRTMHGNGVWSRLEIPESGPKELTHENTNRGTGTGFC